MLRVISRSTGKMHMVISDNWLNKHRVITNSAINPVRVLNFSSDLKFKPLRKGHYIKVKVLNHDVMTFSTKREGDSQLFNKPKKKRQQNKDMIGVYG